MSFIEIGALKMLPIGRIFMTSKQNKILDTLIYFLEKYKKTAMKNDGGTGFEDLVFDQMINVINDLRDENKRLNNLNKPKIIKGEDSE